MTDKTILIVGTWDTKQDELAYIADRIRAQNGGVMTMDVSVLGEPATPCDVSKHQVAEAADSSIQAAIDSGDENTAMQIMALGASRLTGGLHREGRIDGVVILGGTMGTDLALDVCQALPMGVPKYVVSTVSFSPLLPPDRFVLRHPDDPLGRRALWPQLGLQGVVVTSPPEPYWGLPAPSSHPRRTGPWWA